MFQLRREGAGKAHQHWHGGDLVVTHFKCDSSRFSSLLWFIQLSETTKRNSTFHCRIYFVLSIEYTYITTPFKKLDFSFDQDITVFYSKMVSGEERNVSAWSLLSGWCIINDPPSTDGYESIQKCLDVRVQHVPQDAFFFFPPLYFN